MEERFFNALYWAFRQFPLPSTPGPLLLRVEDVVISMIEMEEMASNYPSSKSAIPPVLTSLPAARGENEKRLVISRL